MKDKIVKHYYWAIVLAALTVMTVAGGIVNCRSGIFMIPVTESLGISRGDFSLAMSIRGMVGFVLSMISGALYIRLGYRKVVSIGMLIMAVSMGMHAVSNGMVIICVAAALEGINSLCISTGAPRLIGNWFHGRYGLVMGIVSAGTGLGGSLFSIVLSKAVSAAGWRATYWITAAFLAATALIVWLLVRNRPEEMGLRPYGEGQVRVKQKKRHADHWEGYSMEELKKKPVFYLAILGTFLSCTCIYMAFYVVVPHVQDCGMSPETAATVNSVVMLGLTGAKLVFGYLCDKVGVKATTLIAMIAGVISLWLLAEISDPTSAYIVAGVYAISLTLNGIAPPILELSLFGYRASVSAAGIFLGMISAASMVANPVCNYLRDAIGSYRPIFRVSAVVLAGVTALYLVIYAMANKDRKAWEAANAPRTAE